MRQRFVVPVVVLLVSAVAGCVAPDDGPAAETAQGPGIGQADSLDSADRDCRVVLRSANLVGDEERGFDTSCADGGCWFVWTGLLDVDADLLGDHGRPAVLFHSSEESGWWSVAAERVSGAPVGMRRFAFSLTAHTAFAPPASRGPAADTTVELIPYVALDGGGRLFDHNRFARDFDNYVLSADREWAVTVDPDVCPAGTAPNPAVAVLRFPEGGGASRDGDLVRGGTLRVEYDVARLPLRHTHNGFPCWDIQAFVLFSSDDTPFYTTVNAIGGPADAVYLPPLAREPVLTFEVPVPGDATGVELWFRNFTGCDSPAERWDSDGGANYRFDVD